MVTIQGQQAPLLRVIWICIRHPRAGWGLLMYLAKKTYWWIVADVLYASKFRIEKNYRIHIKGYHPQAHCEECWDQAVGKYPTTYFHCGDCGKHSPWATEDWPLEKIIDELPAVGTGDGVWTEIAILCPQCKEWQ